MSDTPKPIIMQAESVRAILAGRKMQTRRVVKPQPINNRVGMVNAAYCGHPDLWLVDGAVSEYTNHGMTPPQWKSRYQPGDILYVKEAWAEVDDGYGGSHIMYRADKSCWIIGMNDEHNERILCESKREDYGDQFPDEPERWHSPIHMPCWAARLWLKVTDVRVERLQDISEADATAEGVTQDASGYWRGSAHKVKGTPKAFPTAASAYFDVFDAINAKRGYPWESNPWVFAYTFETTNQPEHTKETK